jgi:hypothetical protein
MVSRSQRRWASLRLAAAFSVLAIVCLAAFDQVPAPTTSRVRLAVLVVFDQLRGDYLEKWQDLFEKDGFRRLQTDGAWFQNCHYPYAHTVTAAGHASLLTGCSPSVHGIVGNDWCDPASGQPVYCVGDQFELVPPPSDASRAILGKRSASGVSPRRLLAPTVGDALKKATTAKARIVSLSFKDRSAVLPAGQKPDACYWLDTLSGTFVTSTYYRSTLHPWVAEYNRQRLADAWFGKEWQRLRSDLDYVRYSGPDDVPGEGKGVFQGRAFPHMINGGAPILTPVYYQALYNSPFGNDLLLGLAKRAIDAEGLGQENVSDLLCVSFSCNDPIGHCWGPDSQEVLDVTLRSDLIVRDLLAYLDAKVGRDRYLLALTADHGICPLPEVAQGKGQAAGRIGSDLLSLRSEEFLTEKFGHKGEEGRWIKATQSPWIYLDRPLIRERKLDPSEVEKALAGWLKEQPGIAQAYSRAELTSAQSMDDPLAERARRSFHPDRCGDVTIIPKPYYFIGSSFSTGTTHGTPYEYDTHVPLLVYGPGVVSGKRADLVTPQAIAAIFARGLGIAPPEKATAELPRSLMRD